MSNKDDIYNADSVYNNGAGGSGNDPDAIHDNVAGEINAITDKATPVGADLIIIEDSEDSFNKKKEHFTRLLTIGC